MPGAGKLKMPVAISTVCREGLSTVEKKKTEIIKSEQV